MVKAEWKEEWKKVKFDFPISENFRIEVSNSGRVRTFNKNSNGRMLKGSLLKGYKIIRISLFSPREEKTQDQINRLKKAVVKLGRQYRALAESKASKTVLKFALAELEKKKQELTRKSVADVKKRRIYQHFLVHRLVAMYFLPKPKKGQTMVAHLDYEKLNNQVSNLKWTTPEENLIHQKTNPHVINARLKRKDRYVTKGWKLTDIKVMQLKKLLNEGKPIKQLVKKFKVSDTQILRIKRGENWGHVKPAQ